MLKITPMMNLDFIKALGDQFGPETAILIFVGPVALSNSK